MKAAMKWIAAGVGLALIGGVAYVLVAKSPERAVKRMITEGMRDPASAQFRNVRSYPRGVVCGEVNGKNAMGGYIGFTRFVVTDTGSFYFDPERGFDKDDGTPLESRVRLFAEIERAQCAG